MYFFKMRIRKKRKEGLGRRGRKEKEGKEGEESPAVRLARGAMAAARLARGPSTVAIKVSWHFILSNVLLRRSIELGSRSRAAVGSSAALSAIFNIFPTCHKSSRQPPGTSNQVQCYV